MAGQVHLDPAVGMELAEVLTKFCDQEIQELAQTGFTAVRSLGDDNHCVEEFKTKYQNFQNDYNTNLVPSFASFKSALEEFTDVATYISKLAINTQAAESDAGTIASGAFDAARNL